ncbi:predicted protein [Lichtheimia corymbifera JMRC:FSU:9682]|uniref:F-box domain-containing protein n=1 Tax=Lichtheimia corymbifera JMRC:FSU:9682 TaxID=1263082 RepID=A0A068RXS9_9FUNG|nr:predicted protein [Lichtheimia corymbifera JMRC:FSU:9682]
MTVVENINWSELLNNPIVTAQHGNDSNRIVTATETLQQAAHHLVEVLNERARLSANSAQCDKALSDAAAIVAILPGSGLGYLCTGDMHCQQGRYAAAISIYDQGLEAVSISDPYYHQLVQRRMAAETNNSKRVDFISCLPLDIVITNIIPRALSEFYCDVSSEYLYVSRAWQERFLRQPNGLYYHFGSERKRFFQQSHRVFSKDTSELGHPQLVRFAPYIQSLRVSMDGIHLDDLFSRARFPNLKVLDINCGHLTSGDPILSGLQIVAASLTHLYIMDGSCLRLSDIMESCPNLVSLTTDEMNVGVPLSTCYPKMKHLSIHKLTRTPLDYDTLVYLLSRFPSLLSLDITPRPDCRLLTILHEHCPCLQRLYFGSRSFPASNIEVHPDRRGVTLARLHGYRQHYMQDHVIQFLLTHQNSLETLECDGKIIKHGDAIWKLSDGGRLLQLNGNGDPTQSFTRLANLRFSEGCSLSCGPFITWIVKNAPNLKAISLIEPVLQPAIADVLIKSPHLSKLEITRLWEDDDLFSGDFEGIFDFFLYHISMGAQSTLQEIILHAGMRLYSELEWIHLISKLKCLKNLELLAHFIPMDCIPLLEAIGQGCPALEMLTLGKKDATFQAGLMAHLCKFSNLKCLRIRARALSDNDLVALTMIPSLELLYLECDVPDFIMQRLLKHIPKDSLWNDVCRRPTLTATRPHYEKRASDSTTQLQQCIQNVLTVLDDRAIVLTLSANFATALRDAAAMQEISPLSPLGYLRAAAIYSEQGRQQAVVDICNEGLSIVNVSDPGHSKLQETKTVAMQRDVCGLDFVSQLPFEIVMDVLFPMLLGDDGILDGKKRCPYLDVSKTWFDRIVQACGGGLHFKIADQYSYDEVVRHAQHTKTIQIGYCSQGLWISYFFQRANFCNLREIKIEGLKDDTITSDFVSSFKSVSNTLTHLTIRKSTKGIFQPTHPLRVVDILSNCPHLVMLDIDYQFYADFDAVPLTKTWPQLTTLSLSCRNSGISNEQFLEMLKRLPSLKNLTLHACIEPQSMTMIKRYGPVLRGLLLRANRTQSSSARHEQQHETQWMREGRGRLEKISFSDYSRNGDAWKVMRDMLQQHHNTLVHLDLDLEYAGNNDDDLFNLEYPCLKTLALRCRGSNSTCFGWWIMGKAPRLEELSFNTWVIASHPSLLDITPPSTLRKLAMVLSPSDKVDIPTAIERYLGQFAEHKENLALKELKIRYDFCHDIPQSLPAAIFRLKDLQHLSVAFFPKTTPWKINSFIQMLVGELSDLVSLELNSNTSPWSDGIQHLKRLKYLRHLGFRLSGYSKHSDIRGVFGNFRQLKSIRVFQSGTEGHNFIHKLKDQRPDIKAVADRVSSMSF